MKKSNFIRFGISEFHRITMIFSNVFDSKSALWSVIPLLCLLMFSRRPDAIISPQPWAEDGTVFLHDVFCHSVNSIVIPYAGYYHPLARIVTFLSFQISPLYSIFLMNLFSLIVSVLILSFFLHPLFRSIISHDLLRLLCVGLMISAPCGEIFMNITNLQWFIPIFLIYYSLLIFFNYSGLVKKGNTYLSLIVILSSLFAFSSPYSILLLSGLPYIFICRVHFFKNIHDLHVFLMTVPFITALLYFCMNFITIHNQEFNLTNLTLPIITGILYQFFFKFFSCSFIPQIGLLLISTSLFMILIYYSLLYTRCSISNFLLINLFSYLVILFIARPDYFNYISKIGVWGGERYLYIPYCILILFISYFISKKNPLFIYILSVIFLILAIINFWNYFFISPFIDYQFIHMLCDKLNGNLTNHIPINPEGWSMDFNCDP